MVRIQQLRYLVAVADTLNFSRAAEACNVTQPTLSMQLKEMEEGLKVQLVERTRARVILTPVGEEIVRHARTVLAEVQDIREIARNHTGGLGGTVKIGVVQTVGAYVLSLAMPKIRSGFPDVRINVSEDTVENLPRKLADGTHDVLLCPEPIAIPDFISVALMREPLHLVVPFDHPLASCETIDPTSLRGETILSMDRASHLHDQIARLCSAYGAVDVQDYAGTTLDTLRQMVAVGMGLSLLPALYVRSDVLREKLVVARPLTANAPLRELTMAWRMSSPRQALFKALSEAVKGSIVPWE